MTDGQDHVLSQADALTKKMQMTSFTDFICLNAFGVWSSMLIGLKGRIPKIPKFQLGFFVCLFNLPPPSGNFLLEFKKKIILTPHLIRNSVQIQLMHSQQSVTAIPTCRAVSVRAHQICPSYWGMITTACSSNHSYQQEEDTLGVHVLLRTRMPTLVHLLHAVETSTACATAFNVHVGTSDRGLKTQWPD